MLQFYSGMMIVLSFNTLKLFGNLISVGRHPFSTLDFNGAIITKEKL